MDFPTYLSIPFAQDHDLPEEYGFQDVRYAPALVEHFVQRYTHSGDVVLDPFAGFGTTLTVAKQLGRKAYGIEIDDKKVEYMRKYLDLGDMVIHGDVKRLYLEQKLPKIDLVMTSPPYMGREDHANALTGYRYAGSYEQYLQEMKDIFARIVPILSDTSTIVVEIANLKQDHSLTTLAWDVAQTLSEIMIFQGEIIIAWTGTRRDHGIYNYGYDHSYCLVFNINNDPN